VVKSNKKVFFLLKKFMPKDIGNFVNSNRFVISFSSESNPLKILFVLLYTNSLKIRFVLLYTCLELKSGHPV
jgi:hypothetical protein